MIKNRPDHPDGKPSPPPPLSISAERPINNGWARKKKEVLLFLQRNDTSSTLVQIVQRATDFFHVAG